MLVSQKSCLVLCVCVCVCVCVCLCMRVAGSIRNRRRGGVRGSSLVSKIGWSAPARAVTLSSASEVQPLDETSCAYIKMFLLSN